MEHSWKSLYASERVKAAVREHANEVSLSIPSSKAKVVTLGNSGMVHLNDFLYRLFVPLADLISMVQLCFL